MIIVLEMNKERVDSIDQMSNTFSALMFPANDQETDAERRIRLFKLEYFKKNMPTIDWDELEDIRKKVMQDNETENLKNNINSDENSGMQSNNYGAGGYYNGNSSGEY